MLLWLDTMIQFGSNKIEVGSSGVLYAPNKGVFPMKEGDVVRNFGGELCAHGSSSPTLAVCCL
jgi:hypothetical protein